MNTDTDTTSAAGAPVLDLDAYKAVATAMRELEEYINDLARSAHILDDYISMMLQRAERRADGDRTYELDEATKENLWFLSLDVRRRAQWFLDAFNHAAQYPEH